MSFNDSDDDVPTLVETLNASTLDPSADKQPESSNAKPVSAKVPLTIICGFLGAGKSTLLKRILTERHGYRIAVIMNEFGDTADIEAKTINVSSADDPTAEGSEEFLELANGCLCCSIKDVGVAAMEKLMLKKGAFDYILLETTGLADPGPIASMFWTNEEYANGLADIVLDGVVCVVDGVFGQKQMAEDHSTDELRIGESLRQIAGSDVVLLNKIDLAPPESVAETEQLIRKVNPAAPIYKTIKGEIDLKYIIGIQAFQKPPSVDEAVTPNSHVHTDDCDHDHDEHDEKKPPTHYEVRGISSLQVRCGILDQAHIDKLDAWIRNALWENRVSVRSDEKITSDPVTEVQVQILRAKGAFTSKEGKHFVFQGVRSIYEISELERKAPGVGGDTDVDVPEEGKIVLIGTGLDDRVRKSLESVLR
ncbi:CobW domain-containing protein [Crepidotus variabilis]|uniref:CobW domain-containing protein n=1 Tax=Crepidotus variabilis TaxID=179855 RepID=A0A9P6JW39_9AGAR|nr:CobW domain-containing protein [Crepidotus variabilis]